MKTSAAPDAAEAAQIFAEVAKRSSKLMGDFLLRQAGQQGVAYSDEFGVA